MKKQLLEQVINKQIQFQDKYKIIIPTIVGIIIFFASCQKSSIEKINSLTSELNGPNISAINSKIIYTEEAQIKMKINSPEINRYLEIEDPYTEFPQGMNVVFYDSLERASSFIKANYCIYDETKKIWTAENDVVAVNEDGDTLNTDFLIWNMNTKKIYSDQYVKIINEEGIIHGKGFEANQDFSGWKIKQTSGIISIQDEK
jgi:LPS export ABC transporter protein LptC